MPLFGPPDVSKLRAKDDIDGLIHAAQYTRDPAVAEAARVALVPSIDYLFTLLDSRNLRALAMARDGLKVVGKPAVQRLIFILQNGHVHRREDAAHALGEIGDREAVPSLIEALRHTDPLLRMIAAAALGKIGDQRAVKPLTLHLKDDNQQVAHTARKALDRIGAAKA
ncbi:MAG: HEAT repeat domain-containing protein [Thermoleophilia bacterium]